MPKDGPFRLYTKGHLLASAARPLQPGQAHLSGLLPPPSASGEPDATTAAALSCSAAGTAICAGFAAPYAVAAMRLKSATAAGMPPSRMRAPGLYTETGVPTCT